jgi:hypothetical protein
LAKALPFGFQSSLIQFHPPYCIHASGQHERGTLRNAGPKQKRCCQ